MTMFMYICLCQHNLLIVKTCSTNITTFGCLSDMFIIQSLTNKRHHSFASNIIKSYWHKNKCWLYSVPIYDMHQCTRNPVRNAVRIYLSGYLVTSPKMLDELSSNF